MTWVSKVEAANETMSKPLQNAAANQPGFSSLGAQVFNIQTEASSIISCPAIVSMKDILFSSAHVGEYHISGSNRVVDVLFAMSG